MMMLIVMVMMIVVVMMMAIDGREDEAIYTCTDDAGDDHAHKNDSYTVVCVAAGAAGAAPGAAAPAATVCNLSCR